MINYRTINDLNKLIVKNLSNIPRDIELIVGIPRGGLFVANLISLHLNLPLTDLEGLIENRIIKSGDRWKIVNKSNSEISIKKVLVVDDSINTGSTLERVKQRLRETSVAYDIV